MPITPNDIVDLIKRVYPQSTVTLQSQGAATRVNRYIITTELFGKPVEIRLGENVVFFIEGTPIEISKHAPLQDETHLLKEIEGWLKEFTRYLQKKELPLVRDLARSYLGYEQRVEKKENHITIVYDVFQIVITANLAIMILTVDHRNVFFKKFDNDADLEFFFKGAKLRAEDIRKGLLR